MRRLSASSTMRLSSALDLAKASLTGPQDYSEIPDVAGYADIKHQWDRGYRKTLLSEIFRGECRPAHTEIVDYPKNVVGVRPLARFSARDRLIYDALVFCVSAEIDRSVNPSVYSYRWDHFRGGLIFWYQPWQKMRAIARSRLQQDRRMRLASVDVSSFYEHVDVEILGDDLDCVTRDSQVAGNLKNFLDGFQKVNHAWGLPQGSDASGILANLYLSPVDEYLKQNGFRFLRYSDDIMIFRRNWDELRDVLLGVNKVLRARRLSVSSHKTQIRDPQDSLDYIHDVRRASIQYAVSADYPDVQTDIREYFDEITKEGSVDGGKLRFCLTRLKKYTDDYAVGWCLDHLKFIAHSARDVFSYFRVFKSRLPEIERKLIDFLESDESAGYPYIEQRIYRYFLSVDLRSGGLREIAWSILNDRNRETFPREFASRYIGRDCSVSEAQLLRHNFEEEPDVVMRRALLMALYESSNLSPRYLKGVTQSFPQLKWVCRFLETNPAIPVP